MVKQKYGYMSPIEDLKRNLELLQARDATSIEGMELRPVIAALEDVEDIFAKYSSQITDSELVQRTLEVLTVYEHTPQFQEPKSNDESFFRGLVVQVENAAYVRKMQLATSAYEVKTGRKLPKRTLQDFLSSEVTERKLQLPPEEVERMIEAKFQDLQKERLRLLKNLSTAYQVLFPEGKFAYPKETVTSKLFPQTNAWYMGGFIEGEDELLEKVTDIAAENHIKLFSDTPHVEPTDANTLHLLEYGKTHEEEAAFPQDFVDFSQTTVQIPAMFEELGFSPKNHRLYGQFTQNLIGNRVRRHPLWTKVPDKILH
jgi:ribonuclease HI